ncbi:uncharacterized protein LTHEOB_1264 [Neofusicoccum parvum]|uniref:Uncharacterized protein n=2 Tax=Neofusicoccum parvum TaxID=310453 RepID=R1EQN9_BOTPV|nr:hypothetical protein UCRNP2_3126 [Neofusicoccum parvum UCRNP2]GME28093.1 uncharacterized protein LTHEOB_1264 [Neofusicoccum parvum]GME63767.1 uncharacterized protein LTHEOB_1264 [Neofusicoccum parvum]
MSRLYSYIFGNRHQHDVEMKLQLLEKKLEDAEMVGRYRDAKIAALVDRIEGLESEFRRQKTTLLQQTTALEEQLVHARQTRSNSIVQPLQPITDTSEPKPAVPSADVFLVDPETAQPLTALKIAECVAPGRREHITEISTTHLDEPFLKNKLRALLEAYGRGSEELGISAKDMYQSNEKGQIAYCLCNDNLRPDAAANLRTLLGTLTIKDPEKTG